MSDEITIRDEFGTDTPLSKVVDGTWKRFPENEGNMIMGMINDGGIKMPNDNSR